MRLSLSEENILREYQATTQAQQYNLNQEQLQSLKASACIPFAKHLQAESLSTLSQGNTTLSQINNNGHKPASSERRQLRYGGGQRGDSSQVKCVFELYHDDDEDNNNNSNNNVQDHRELEYSKLVMSSNLDASVRISENNNNSINNHNRTFSYVSGNNIRPSPKSAFSSSRNNNNSNTNYFQGQNKQSIQQYYDQPSKFLYNTILSGISNGTGPISQNLLEVDTEQFQQIARIPEDTSKMIPTNNQLPNYSDIIDTSAYTIIPQNNKNNKSIDRQPKGFFTSSNHSSMGSSSESSQITNNSKNQISRQAGISWDSRNINDYWNSNYNSAAEALTQASLQSRKSKKHSQIVNNRGIYQSDIGNAQKVNSIQHRRSFETSGLSQSLQDRVLVINQEDHAERVDLLSDKEIIEENGKLMKQGINNRMNYDQKLNQHQIELKWDQKQKQQCQQQQIDLLNSNENGWKVDKINELIDQFNQQSRIKISGMKSYEKQHCHDRFFQQEIPLSYEEEQHFYLETSARKTKGEYTKRVVSPSTDKENRSNNVIQYRQVNTKDNNINNKDNKNMLISLKECQQDLQEYPKKELRTFESGESSDTNEYIDNYNNNSNNQVKQVDSPCNNKSIDNKDERLKQFFSFQKNESTAVKKQFQNNPSLQQPSLGFNGSQLAMSQIHTFQLESHENVSDRQKIQKRNNIKQQDKNIHDSKRDYNKSQSQRSTGRNVLDQCQSQSYNNKKEMNNNDKKNDVCMIQDAATQVSHQISRDTCYRNGNDQQSQQSSHQYSPMLQVQGVVCDLSFPSMTSKECRSQQNSINHYDQHSQTNQQLSNQLNSVCSLESSQQEQHKESQYNCEQQQQYPTKDNKSDSMSITTALIPKNELKQMNYQSLRTNNNGNKVIQQDDQILEDQQKSSRRSHSNLRNQVLSKVTNNAKGSQGDQQEQLDNNNSLVRGSYENHKLNNQNVPQKVLFYNPFLEENANQQQPQQNPQEISKSSRILRSNSCYSTDRCEYQGCLQPKIKTSERSQGNSLRNNKIPIKRKVPSKEMNHKNNSFSEEKKTNKLSKLPKKNVLKVEKQAKTKHIQNENNSSFVVLAVVAPADNKKKNEKISSHSDLTRIRSKSLIEKIQHEAISRDYVTYLIQQHASCCRNFRKELQTSLCNN